jgi:hypothetical protein
MRRKRPIGCEELEKIVDKILLVPSSKKSIRLSTREGQALAQLYFDYQELKERFTVEHFELLDFAGRQRKAYEILTKEDKFINLTKRHSEMVKVLGFDFGQKSSIRDLTLFVRYAELVLGSEHTIGVPIHKEDAIKKLAKELKVSNQAVLDKLKRAIKRMKSKGEDKFPEKFQGILPSRWPLA